MSIGDPVPEPLSQTPETWATRIRTIAQHQVARFASVGVANTLVDLGLFILLSAAGMGVLAANFISTSAGMAVSFLGNRRYVFGASGHILREITLFVIVCAIGIWAIQPAVILGVTRVLDGMGLSAENLTLWFAKCVAILIAAVWNFFLYKYLVFRAPVRSARG